jgi:hypothetical protein
MFYSKTSDIMNPILRNILAFLGAGIIGMIVNGGMINISGSIIPFPAGFDPKDMNAGMHL